MRRLRRHARAAVLLVLTSGCGRVVGPAAAEDAGKGDEPAVDTGPSEDAAPPPAPPSRDARAEDVAPTAYSPLRGVQVSAGAAHTCVRTEDGAAACWGRTLGASSIRYPRFSYWETTFPRGLPRPPRPGPYTDISTFRDVVCALDSSRKLECWGARRPDSGGSGLRWPDLCDDDLKFCSGTPEQMSGTLVSIDVGGEIVVGLEPDGTARFVALAAPVPSDPPSEDASWIPEPPASGVLATGVRALSAGFRGPCGLLEDGTIRCWDPLHPSREPLEAPDGRFRAISCSRWEPHCCAIRMSGEVSCWGESWWAEVEPAGRFEQISTPCGIGQDGTVQCWDHARNPRSELFDSRMHGVPTGVFLQVSAGVQHACGVRAEGTVACWGQYNPHGERDVPPAGWRSDGDGCFSDGFCKGMGWPGTTTPCRDDGHCICVVDNMYYPFQEIVCPVPGRKCWGERMPPSSGPIRSMAPDCAWWECRLNGELTACPDD